MLIESYQKAQSIKKTAYLWGTSRDVVRKWIRRWEERGVDLSRKPKDSPNKVPEEIEEKVIKKREERNYGKRRLCYFLWKEEKIRLSESTVGKILRGNNLTRGKKKRKVFYPAIWVYARISYFLLSRWTQRIYTTKGLWAQRFIHTFGGIDYRDTSGHFKKGRQG